MRAVCDNSTIFELQKSEIVRRLFTYSFFMYAKIFARYSNPLPLEQFQPFWREYKLYEYERQAGTKRSMSFFGNRFVRRRSIVIFQIGILPLNSRHSKGKFRIRRPSPVAPSHEYEAYNLELRERGVISKTEILTSRELR